MSSSKTPLTYSAPYKVSYEVQQDFDKLAGTGMFREIDTGFYSVDGSVYTEKEVRQMEDLLATLTYKNWSSFFWQHVLHKIQVPDKLWRVLPRAATMSLAHLYHVYESPHCFYINDEERGRVRRSIDFDMYMVLHDIMQRGAQKANLLFVNVPPEYPFLLFLAATNEIAPKMSSKRGDVISLRNTFAAFTTQERVGIDHKIIKEDWYDGQWRSKKTSGIQDRFYPNPLSSCFNRSLIDKWPEYWASLKRQQGQHPVAIAARSIMDLVPPVQPFARTTPRSPYKFEREVIAMEEEDSLSHMSFSEQTKKYDPSDFYKLIHDSTEDKVYAVKCGSGDCAPSYEKELLSRTGPLDLSTLFSGAKMEIPSLPNLPEATITYLDENCEDPLYTITTPILTKVASTPLKSVATAHPIDAGNDVLVPDVSSSDIVVDKTAFDFYVKVDSVVAAKSNNTYYDKTVFPQPVINPVVGKGDASTAILGRLPHTFRKGAWLFSELNWTSIRSDGSFPLVNEFILNENGKDFLEYSASPHGFKMAAVGSGIAKTYQYTEFKGEKTVPCPYETGTLNNFNTATGKKIVSLYDLADVPGCEKGDIESITRRATTLTYQRELELQSNKPTQDWTKHEKDVLIIDIPVWRNSTQMIDLRKHLEIQKASKFEEMPESVPLGKSESTARLIKFAVALRDFHLRPGGALLMKVIEPWSGLVARALYDLARCFKKATFLTNPFSKDASKEVYVALEEYVMTESEPIGRRIEKPWKEPIVHMVPKNILDKAHFYTALAKFNTFHCVKSAFSLLEITRRYGKLCYANRSILCRCHLIKSPCLPLFKPIDAIYRPAPISVETYEIPLAYYDEDNHEVLARLTASHLCRYYQITQEQALEYALKRDNLRSFLLEVSCFNILPRPFKPVKVDGKVVWSENQLYTSLGGEGIVTTKASYKKAPSKNKVVEYHALIPEDYFGDEVKVTPPQYQQREPLLFEEDDDN